MSLLQEIKNYKPLNEQEVCDKERMIEDMMHLNFRDNRFDKAAAEKEGL